MKLKSRLVFGDPESIRLRDEARVEAERLERMHECETCNGTGYITTECDDCDGSGEIENDEQ